MGMLPKILSHGHPYLPPDETQVSDDINWVKMTGYTFRRMKYDHMQFIALAGSS